MTPSHIPTTIFDRLRLAWQGFKTSTKRNPQWDIDKELEERRQLAEWIGRLPENVQQFLHEAMSPTRWGIDATRTLTEAEVTEWLAAIDQWPDELDRCKAVKAISHRLRLEWLHHKPAREWAMRHSSTFAQLAK